MCTLFWLSYLGSLERKLRVYEECKVFGETERAEELVHSIGKSQLNFLPSLCYHSPPLEVSLKNKQTNKLNIELLYDPAIPQLGIYPEKTIIQKQNKTKHKYSNVHSSTIYYSQDKKAT